MNKSVKNDEKQIKDFIELIDDIQKNILNRADNIQNRAENIKLEDDKLKSEEKGKWWQGILSKSNSIAKGTTAMVAKSLINVELLASQEEAAGDLKLEGLGLLDKIQAGKKNDKEISIDTGKEILNLMQNIKDDLTKRIDEVEDKLNILNIEKTEKVEDIKLPDKITNVGEAYEVMENVYQGLSNRLNKIEDKLKLVEIDLKQDKKLVKSKSPKIPEGEEPKLNITKKDEIKETTIKQKNKSKKKSKGMSL